MTIHFNFWRTIRTEPRLKLRLTNEPRLNVLGSKCRWLATSFDVNAMLMLSLATNNAKHYTPLWGQKVSKILEIQATIRYVSFTFIHTYVWCVCVCKGKPMITVQSITWKIGNALELHPPLSGMNTKMYRINSIVFSFCVRQEQIWWYAEMSHKNISSTSISFDSIAMWKKT